MVVPDFPNRIIFGRDLLIDYLIQLAKEQKKGHSILLARDQQKHEQWLDLEDTLADQKYETSTTPLTKVFDFDEYLFASDSSCVSPMQATLGSTGQTRPIPSLEADMADCKQMIQL